MGVREEDNYDHIRFLKEVFSGNYITLLMLVIIQLIAGICPIATSYFVSKLIDAVAIAQTIKKPIDFFEVNYFVVFVCACTIFLLLDEIFTVLHEFYCDSFEDKIYQRIKNCLFKKISFYPTNIFFEDCKITNLITLSHKSAQEFTRHIGLFSYSMKGIFSLIPSLIAAYFLQWWVPFFLDLSHI